MSGFSSLEIGKKALIAQRFGLEVTSNNIANVNTPGYSRRTAVLSEDTSVRRNGFFMGNSVIVQKIQTYRSEYYDREIRTTTSRKSTFDVDSQFLKRVETALGEPLNDDIDSLITDFFKSFDQVALNPDNSALRSYIIDKGVALSERFNRVAQSFDDLRRESQTSINNSIPTVNNLLKDIVNLNKESAYNRNSNGDVSQKYADDRELKLQELSKFFDIKVSENEDTTVNVFLNGINLVSGVYYSEVGLNVNIDPLNSQQTLELVKRDIETGVETALQPQAGEIFANMRIFNETLNPDAPSSSKSISSDFNNFVNELATQINDIMITGFGMNDLTGPSPGRPFFDNSGVITASTIKVNAALINDPTLLPLSEFAGEPGNTGIASQVARLSEDKNFLSNMTPNEYYSSYIAKVGSMAREAVNGLSTSKLVDEQLNTLRESSIGVNLDEEAVNLIKFQKAFEAASRIINMTNEMMTTLINLGR